MGFIDNFIKVVSWSIMFTHFFSLLPKVGQVAPCASTSCAKKFSEWMLEKASLHWADTRIMLILSQFIPKLGRVLATGVDTKPKPRSTRLTLKNIARDAAHFWMEKFPPLIQSQRNAPLMEAWILLVWLIACKVLSFELSCVQSRCFRSGCKTSSPLPTISNLKKVIRYVCAFLVLVALG